MTLAAKPGVSPCIAGPPTVRSQRLIIKTGVDEGDGGKKELDPLQTNRYPKPASADLTSWPHSPSLDNPCQNALFGQVGAQNKNSMAVDCVPPDPSYMTSAKPHFIEMWVAGSSQHHCFLSTAVWKLVRLSSLLRLLDGNIGNERSCSCPSG
jgi:hypothetical protein